METESNTQEMFPPIDFGCSHKFEEYVDYRHNPPKLWNVDLKGKSCSLCKLAREKGLMK